jgi:hypothetical protein
MDEWNARVDVVLDLLGADGLERDRLRPLVLRLLLVACRALFVLRARE